VNLTLTVQDEPAAMLLPQVFVWLKSPEVAIEVTGAAALATVGDRDGLRRARRTGGNGAEAGVRSG